MTTWPSVGVVIPTHNRPEQVRAAIAGVRAQDYRGTVTTVVVHDRSEPDQGLADGSGVRVMANGRTPGLAGARNSGVLALGTELIAFCDDDDVWLPGKLTAQVRAMQARPGAEFASCGILVLYAGHRSPRLAGDDQITYADLLRSRMAMVHSSTYLVQRSALLGGIGLLDEGIPGSQNEDWDLLLRAARRAPIVHLDEPLVRVLWGRTSHYAYEYATKISSLRWMMRRHPEIAGSKPGAARVYGQLACWSAATGNRSQAWQFSKEAVRANWKEPRTAIALAAMTGAVKVENVLSALHRRGRGI